MKSSLLRPWWLATATAVFTTITVVAVRRATEAPSTSSMRFPIDRAVQGLAQRLADDPDAATAPVTLRRLASGMLDQVGGPIVIAVGATEVVVRSTGYDDRLHTADDYCCRVR
jgi:hypothetical protein